MMVSFPPWSPPAAGRGPRFLYPLCGVGEARPPGASLFRFGVAPARHPRPCGHPLPGFPWPGVKPSSTEGRFHGGIIIDDWRLRLISADRGKWTRLSDRSRCNGRADHGIDREHRLARRNGGRPGPCRIPRWRLAGGRAVPLKAVVSVIIAVVSRLSPVPQQECWWWEFCRGLWSQPSVHIPVPAVMTRCLCRLFP